MKIAIYHDLPSGGAKRALYEIGRRLAERHELDVYTLSTADTAFCDLRPFAGQHQVFPFQPLPLYNSPFGRLNQWQRRRDLGRLDQVNQQVAAAINEGGYDLAYVHPSMWTQAPQVLAYLKLPSLYQIQEPLRRLYEPDPPRPYERVGWRGRLDRLDPLISLYRQKLAAVDRQSTLSAGRLLANSRFSAANIERAYGRPADFVYLGIDAEAFRPLPGVEKENFVLSVGALRPKKGFDFLIQALARLPVAERPALRLVANADNPLERPFLEELARAKGVALEIETKVDEATLQRRYNQARLVLYAPISEPFGFVPLEAMACGTAVVGVAEGGVRETVVDGSNGRLVERDEVKFAAAVRELLGDRGLREKFGRQGREQVLEQWTWERCVAGVELRMREAARC